MLATAQRPRVSVDRTAPFLWYTLCVNSQAQKWVCERARELEIETYVPMSREPPAPNPRFPNRSREPVERPLMPGYVFVSLRSSFMFDIFQPSDHESDRPEPLPPDARAGYFAKWAEPAVGPIWGCLGFLCGPDGPMAVSEAVIEDMRLRERNGEFDSGRKSEASHRKWVKAVKWARQGLTIQFCGDDCPFAGRFGKITQVGERAELIEIDFEIMGRVTSISAPLDWIRRMR
jgi:transcription antitermination factor NusG